MSRNIVIPMFLQKQEMFDRWHDRIHPFDFIQVHYHDHPLLVFSAIYIMLAINQIDEDKIFFCFRQGLFTLKATEYFARSCMISRKQDAKSVLCRLAENTVEIISIRKIGTNSNILACFGSCGKMGFNVY